MKKLVFALSVAALVCCKKHSQTNAEQKKLNEISREYVKLGLSIGAYDIDFVDAYYGPDSLKPATTDTAQFPKEELLQKAAKLRSQLDSLLSKTASDTVSHRAAWLSAQLKAYDRRIRIFSGEFENFDIETKALFDATAPVHEEAHFKQLVAQLDGALPGKGNLPDRFQQLAKRFLIPKNKVDTVFRAAIAEARKRTLAHYQLPAGETFKLEYVTDKPWSGYNWYKGNYNSVIQINVSQPIFIDRAIDLACHEGYPGHHVYNVLLEKTLYREKGWTEISLYPLFSPQSLIAEGSANYGIAVAFPGSESQQFSQNVLLPLAGLDTTGAGRYFQAIALRSKLNYARNEVARGLLNQSMSDTEAHRWLTDYCLLTDKGATDYLRFIRKYRGYVINYNYGQDLVKNYIEGNQSGMDANARWARFEKLLSNETKASDLLGK